MIIGVERAPGHVVTKRWVRQVVTRRMRAWLLAGEGRKLYRPPPGRRIGTLGSCAEAWARHAEKYGEDVT